MGRKLKAYAIFDIVAKNYGRPFFVSSDEDAIQVFKNSCSGSMNTISPSDFILFYLADYDLVTADIKVLKNPLLVIAGSSLKLNGKLDA